MIVCFPSLALVEGNSAEVRSGFRSFDRKQDRSFYSIKLARQSDIACNRPCNERHKKTTHRMTTSVIETGPFWPVTPPLGQSHLWSVDSDSHISEAFALPRVLRWRDSRNRYLTGSIRVFHAKSLSRNSRLKAGDGRWTLKNKEVEIRNKKCFVFGKQNKK